MKSVADKQPLIKLEGENWNITDYLKHLESFDPFDTSTVSSQSYRHPSHAVRGTSHGSNKETNPNTALKLIDKLEIKEDLL